MGVVAAVSQTSASGSMLPFAARDTNDRTADEAVICRNAEDMAQTNNRSANKLWKRTFVGNTNNGLSDS